MHKGKRIADAEYFDDIISTGGVGGTGNAGILQSMGLDDYDSVREEVETEGLRVEINCRFCNSKRGIVLEWVELYQVGSNGPNLPLLVPQGWQFSINNGTAVFIHRCPSCGEGQGLAIHMTPDEARRHVEAAAQANLITPQVLQQWKAQVAAFRSRHRG